MTATPPGTARRASEVSPAPCRLLRGPFALPIRAIPALALRGETLDVALNEDGHGRSFSFPAGAAAPADFPGPEGAGGGALRGLAVPCVMAADRTFCPDRSGAVHRSVRGVGDNRVIASSRSGSRIAAAGFGGSHVAVAYLASRKTTEGWVSEAWLAVDDEAPLRFSEDGSGATAVALAANGPELIALTVDARMALTAVHARAVTYDQHARLGEDAVVSVGGPGNRRTAAALVVASDGPAWCLLPIAKDVGSFGLAIVRVDSPPRVDEPVVWSMYPNGLDPAPVAAATGKHRTFATRVRPEAADPTSHHVLELGQVDRAGTFVSLGFVGTTGDPIDVTLIVDPHDAIWLGWLDAAGSWLEQWGCNK